MELTVVAKELKLMAIHKGIIIHQYLRQLVGDSHIPPGLSPAYTRSSENMPKFRLPIRPHGWSGLTYTGPLVEPSGKNIRNTVTTGLSGPAVHV